MLILLMIVITLAVALSAWQYRYYHRIIKGLNIELRFYKGKHQQFEGENTKMKITLDYIKKFKHFPPSHFDSEV